jgi:hypothetical protein
MNMLLKKAIGYIILIFLVPLKLLSQDISGTWTGFLHTRDTDLVYELVISENNAKSSGYSLTVYTVNNVENSGIKSVTIRKKKQSITIEDDQLIYDNYTTPPKHIKLFGFLSLSTADSIMRLSGKFHTRLLDHRSSDINEYDGTIDLQKQNNFKESKLIAQLDKMHLLNTLAFIPPKTKEKEKQVIASTEVLKPEPSLTKKVNPGETPPRMESSTAVIVKPPAKPINSNLKKEVPVNKPKSLVVKKEQVIQPEVLPSKVTAKIPNEVRTQGINPAPSLINKMEDVTIEMGKRKTEVIQNILFTSDSLILSLYDNGTVDGDTVSVVLNGKIIVSKKELTENAIRVIVPVTADLGDSILLTMYAENLGSIPPNTGLLIIEDGSNRHEIRFEGDMQKSSGVILRRRR